MKHIITLVAIFIGIGTASGADMTKEELMKRVADLGGDGFRTRRSAQKAVLAELKARQTAYLQTLVKSDLKESKKLKAMAETIETTLKDLETTATATDDPEIKERLRKILKGVFPSMVFGQEFRVQKLIVEKFSNVHIQVEDDGDTMAPVSHKVTPDGAVLEICDLRIIRLGLTESGVYTSKLPINYNRGSQSSSGSGFSYKASGGTTTCTWQKWSFTINASNFIINDHKIPIGNGKNILIVDSAGNYKTHFSLNN